MYYPYIHLGLSLNGYISMIIPIKHLLNFKCHETFHAHCIRCKDPILISCKQSSATYFELHNFKVGYVFIPRSHLGLSLNYYQS
jgi:hypothetical protein